MDARNGVELEFQWSWNSTCGGLHFNVYTHKFPTALSDGVELPRGAALQNV